MQHYYTVEQTKGDGGRETQKWAPFLLRLAHIDTAHMPVVKLAHVSKVWLSSHMTINYHSKKDSGYSMQADKLVERLESETDLSA